MEYGPTEEAIKIKDYILKKWGKHFRVDLEVAFRDMFPEPDQLRLKPIWHAAKMDVLVRSKKGFVCVIEPGGAHHFNDEEQIKNDDRRDQLCHLNGLNTFRLINGLMDKLPKREWRKLLGSYLFRMS